MSRSARSPSVTVLLRACAFACACALLAACGASAERSARDGGFDPDVDAGSDGDRDRDGVPDQEDGCPDGELSHGLLVRGCRCAEGLSAAGRGERCLDIDECALDNGGCGSFRQVRCINRVDQPPLCEDIDECAVDNGGCGDPLFTRCSNRPSAPVLCDDINECAVDNGGCGDPLFTRCTNEFAAAPTCTDVDECASDNGGCGDPALVKCFNREGAPPLCDLDECSMDNGGCGELGCIDQFGAPPLCDYDECAAEAVNCGSFVCRNTSGGYQCVCPDDAEDVFGDANRCAKRVRVVALSAEGGAVAQPQGAVVAWGKRPLVPPHLPPEIAAIEILKLASAEWGTCAIVEGGRLTCRGDADNEIYAWETPYQDVAVGAGFVCAVQSGGKLDCWGPQGLVTQTFQDLAQVSARGSVVCLRRAAGEVLCSGADWAEHAAEQAGRASVVGVGNMVCTIDEAGELRCWGAESSFRIAAGQASDRFVQLGGDCALRASGQALCWDARGKAVATTLAGETLSSVVGFNGSYCGITVGGALRCSGDAAFMDPRMFYRAVRVVDGGVCARAEGCEQCTPDVRQALQTMGFEGCSDRLVTNGQHGCLVRDDHKLQCWGRYPYLGSHVDTPPTSNEKYREVQVAEYVTCGLTVEGRLRCWGADSAVSSWLSADVPALKAYTTSAQFVCGIATDGTLQCWGSPGETAEGPLSDGHDWLQVSAYDQVCAVDATSHAQCWSPLGEPQWSADHVLAVLDTTQPPDPLFEDEPASLLEDGTVHSTFHALPRPVSAIAGGHQTLCGLRANGTFVCDGKFRIDTSAFLITR